MKISLLLNSDWSPLGFLSPIRALCLVMRGRAEVVSFEAPSLWDESYSTPTTSYQVPATVRMLNRVDRRHTAPRFRKRVLFDRDDWTCQYCDVKLPPRAITIDHVIPKSKGGPTSWRNCVVCCLECNLRKGPRTPVEADMRLRRQPKVPTAFDFLKANAVNWHPDWSHFLGCRR